MCDVCLLLSISLHRARFGQAHGQLCAVIVLLSLSGNDVADYSRVISGQSVFPKHHETGIDWHIYLSYVRIVHCILH